MQISVDGLTKDFDDHRVIDSVSLDLADVHGLVIVGPSGGGKTTFLRIIAGLLMPTAGTVVVNGRQLTFEERRLREYRKHIGMVFQAYNLFPHLTALHNITLPLIKVHGYSKSDAEAVAMDLLKRFQLEVHAHKKPAQLSGGQKQRVALSRAIAIGPEFLVLDEPTSALDPEFTAEVLDMIEELRESGRDLILVTHEMGFARVVSDFVIFMADGKIAEMAPPGELFENPKNPAVHRFLDRVLKY